jgi:hypothetical protein
MVLALLYLTRNILPIRNLLRRALGRPPTSKGERRATLTVKGEPPTAPGPRRAV